MKPKPWSMNIGMAIGLIVGMLLWWSSYIPSAGLSQNLRLIFWPMVCSVFIVSFRNRWRKVGPYDPEVIAKNRKGRV